MYTTAARIEPADNDAVVAMIVASLCMFRASSSSTAGQKPEFKLERYPPLGGASC